ncbi:MAG: hypothetical protein LBH90_00560 [Tannerella sp.]|jgi:hypothetical protein|nr:hypothetical protein [Tannerella sp.]
MNNIRQLLKKFYNGISTPREEHCLKEFFLKEEAVDDCWKIDQQLFKALYREEAEMPLPAGISERLEQAIDNMGRRAQQFAIKKRRILLYRISSAAAVVFICMGLFFMDRRSVEPHPADTFDDPVEAAIAAEKVLAFMSSQLNKGLNQVADAAQEFEKVDQVLSKHLK